MLWYPYLYPVYFQVLDRALDREVVDPIEWAGGRVDEVRDAWEGLARGDVGVAVEEAFEVGVGAERVGVFGRVDDLRHYRRL